MKNKLIIISLIACMSTLSSAYADNKLLESNNSNDNDTIHVIFNQEISNENITNYNLDDSNSSDFKTAETTSDDVPTFTLGESDLTNESNDYTDLSNTPSIPKGTYLKSDNTTYDFDKSLESITTDYKDDLSIFADFDNLKSLTLMGRSNLNGIEKCKQIRRLSLFGIYSEEKELTNILTVKLDNLPYLSELNILGYESPSYVRLKASSSDNSINRIQINDCKIKNINAVTNLLNLKSLHLEDVDANEALQINKLENIEELTNIRMFIDGDEAKINYTGNFVEGLSKLKYLTWYNTVSSPAYDLSSLKELTTLKLSNFELGDFDIAKKLPSLVYLNLQYSNLDKLIIKDNTNLEYIDIINTEISNLTYSNNPSVKNIFISNTLIKETIGYNEIFAVKNIDAGYNTRFLSTDQVIEPYETLFYKDELIKKKMYHDLFNENNINSNVNFDDDIRSKLEDFLNLYTMGALEFYNNEDYDIKTLTDFSIRHAYLNGLTSFEEISDGSSELKVSVDYINQNASELFDIDINNFNNNRDISSADYNPYYEFDLLKDFRAPFANIVSIYSLKDDTYLLVANGYINSDVKNPYRLTSLQKFDAFSYKKPRYTILAKVEIMDDDFELQKYVIIDNNKTSYIKGVYANNMNLAFNTSYDQLRSLLEKESIAFEYSKIDSSGWNSDHTMLSSDDFDLTFNSYHELYLITIKSNILNSAGNFIGKDISDVIKKLGEDYKYIALENESIYDYHYGDSSIYFSIKDNLIESFSLSMYHYDNIRNYSK